MPPVRFNHHLIEAAIVDLDGTMVDTLGDFVVVLNRMLADLQLPAIDRGFIERTVGQGSEHLLRCTLALSQDAAGVQALFPRAWASYEAHYLAINGDHSDVYPGVVEGLERLKARGVKLACTTNKPTAFAKPLLEKKGLARYFSVLYGGDAFERKKPDPLPLLKTCEALGVAPSRTLMLGDSSNDAKAARAAGCPVALVTYGYNHGEPVQGVDADAYLDRLDQLLLG